MARTSNTVKDYQLQLARLAAAHTKAQARFQAVQSKRARVVAEQDRLVADAEEGLHRAIVDIAVTFGTEMAADLAGLDAAEVRRFAKAGGRG
jgi:hypothetical protein